MVAARTRTIIAVFAAAVTGRWSGFRLDHGRCCSRGVFCSSATRYRFIATDECHQLF
jgi:hypothetical protein